MRGYRYSWLFLFVGIFFVGANAGFAQQKMNHTSSDLDGTVWMQSTEQEKEAFLLGAGSAVVLEYHVRNKLAEEPSKFIRGWIEALKDMTWVDLAHKIDGYYKNNPDKMNRPVFDVIWAEVIAPTWKN